MSTHDQLVELIDHLQSVLDPVKAEKPYFCDWTDGNKLRALAYAQLAGAHFHHHHGPGESTVEDSDLVPVRELLRIAARVDILDELEANETKEQE